MSRIITGVLIFISIFGLTVYESSYTAKISNQVKEELETSVVHFLNDELELSKTALQSADKLWNDSKELLNIFLMQNDTENIADKISVSENALEYNKDLFPIECKKAVDSLEVIIRSVKPYFDNVF